MSHHGSLRMHGGQAGSTGGHPELVEELPTLPHQQVLIIFNKAFRPPPPRVQVLAIAELASTFPASSIKTRCPNLALLSAQRTKVHTPSVLPTQQLPRAYTISTNFTQCHHLEATGHHHRGTLGQPVAQDVLRRFLFATWRQQWHRATPRDGGAP